ncbi:MAG: GxxExxY protein [Bacteroidota bacterium]
MTPNDITYQIIGAALNIHKTVGPGLLESTYEAALAYDLRLLGFNVKTQHPLPFIYKEIRMEVGYRIDLLVNNVVLVEIKSVENLAPVHHSQTLTYLRLSGKELGLLINFNTAKLVDGIHRFKI